MNTKVEEALADLDELEAYFAERADVVDGDYGQPEPNEAMRQHAALSAAIHAISIHIAQQDATIARLTSAGINARRALAHAANESSVYLSAYQDLDAALNQEQGK